MSYTYLQEQGEESSAECFSDIPAYVLSRLNLIAGKSCCKDSVTEFCQSSPSGTTLKPSMENPGKDLSMLSVADSLVLTLAQQVEAQALRVLNQDFGKKWHASLAKYNRATHSWKTHQCLLFEAEHESLEILPKWGMIAGGELWELMIAVPLTDEN